MEVIYTPDIFSVQRHGGISRYFTELIRRLPGAGMRPIVAAGLHRNAYLRELPGILGVHVTRAGRRRWFNEPWCRAVCRLHPCAIVHETYFRAVPYGRRNRTVLTVYDMIDERCGPRSENPKMYRDASDIKRVACERATHIIAISEATRQDLIQLFGTDPAKVTVVHLATSFGVEAPPPPVAPPARPERPFLLHVGWRGGYKNFDVLLEAYAASASLRASYDLVCFGGSEFDARERARLSELGVEKSVRRLSGGDAALQAVYRTAAAYVCPSLLEGFGIPILEAMSQRCPVVCARTAALEEVAGDAALSFDPRSSEDLRSTLETGLDQPANLVALADRGAARVRQFSWDRCLAETVAVYRKLT